MGRHKEYEHGFERHSPEWRRMVYICNRYKISNQEYCENIDKYRERPKTTYEPGSAKYKKNVYLKSLYNITLEEYNTLFTNQQGCCAICGKHQVEFDRALAVDHCHETGVVRGLLCFACNSGIGKLQDNPDIILKAYQYLKQNLEI